MTARKEKRKEKTRTRRAVRRTQRPAKGKGGHGSKKIPPKTTGFTWDDLIEDYKNSGDYENFDETDRFHPGWPGYYGDN
jgi:hypothetical protein